MKKHRASRLNRYAAVCCVLGASACGDDGGSGSTSTVAATVTSDTGTPAVTSTTTAVTGTVDTSSMTASTGAGGATGTVTGTTGEVVTCEIASLTVFGRSDTDDVWDDNDFSDVTIAGGCPTILDVTWPHEDDWEDEDPSESNFEETHFTLDSYAFGGDLTGKQLNLTIELTDDVWGPEATDGAYLVSLVSVSTYQYEVDDTGTGGTGGTTSTDTSSTAGLGGVTSTGTSETVTTSSVGGTSNEGGAGGEAPILQTGYTETETPRESRLLLRFIGDRATLVFPLPDKTDEVDSYDPATAIKINVRIYNMSYDMMDEGMGGAGGFGGTGGDAGVGGVTGTGMTGMGMTGMGMSSTETTGTETTGTETTGTETTGTETTGAETTGTTGIGTTGTETTGTETTGTTGTGTTGTGGTAGTGGDSSTGGTTSKAIFDYVTSQFTITHLSVTERGQRP